MIPGTELLAHPRAYLFWQGKFAEQKLAPMYAHNDMARVRRVLDVGCGEGVLTHRWAVALAPARVVGIDLDDPLLAAEWATRPAPNLTYIAQRAEALPFGAGEFDLACAIEVLEHVPDPDHTLAEMARCAARHVLVSVPREPLCESSATYSPGSRPSSSF